MKKNFILLKTDSLDNFIVTELLEETDTQLLVNYPIVIRLMNDYDKGLFSVHSVKVMPFSMNNVVAYSKNSIVAMSKPNEMIIKYYLGCVEGSQRELSEELERAILQDDLVDDLDEELGVDSLLSMRSNSNTSIH
jgi:hypothetical protein